MKPIVREFARLTDRYYWQTAIMIAQNNLARAYRNSFLGILWTLLQPLVMVLIYSVVMPLIMRFPIEHYLLYIVVSLPLWTFIASSMTTASVAILNQAETLKRCMISTTVFPVADVLKNVYTYLLSFLTMYTVASFFAGPFHGHVLLLPLFFLPVLVTVMALSITIAFIAPYVRDIGEVVFVLMNVFIWLTPVFYSPEVVPEDVRALLRFNPLYLLMRPVQEVAYYNRMPQLGEGIAQCGVALAAVMLGYIVYRKTRRNYVYYL